MTCAICQTRRPRRFCPGVHGDICTICCGTEREVTVHCPLDCPHLRDARRHERLKPIDEAAIPNREVRITEQFLQEHEALLSALGHSLVQAGLTTPGAVDSDLREAIAALIRTHRTLATGLYYESTPENPVAAAIFRAMETEAAEFRRRETEESGITRTRDADVLNILIFFERLELDRNNGRRLGRAFLDFLTEIYPASSETGEGSSSSLLVG